MTKKLLTGMILGMCISIGATTAAAAVVVIGLEIISTQSYRAYGQWMDPAEVNEIYHDAGHSNSGFIAVGNQTNSHK